MHGAFLEIATNNYASSKYYTNNKTIQSINVELAFCALLKLILYACKLISIHRACVNCLFREGPHCEIVLGVYVTVYGLGGPFSCVWSDIMFCDLLKIQ